MILKPYFKPLVFIVSALILNLACVFNIAFSGGDELCLPLPPKDISLPNEIATKNAAYAEQYPNEFKTGQLSGFLGEYESKAGRGDAFTELTENKNYEHNFNLHNNDFVRADTDNEVNRAEFTTRFYRDKIILDDLYRQKMPTSIRVSDLLMYQYRESEKLLGAAARLPSTIEFPSVVNGSTLQELSKIQFKRLTSVNIEFSDLWEGMKKTDLGKVTHHLIEELDMTPIDIYVVVNRTNIPYGLRL